MNAYKNIILCCVGLNDTNRYKNYVSRVSAKSNASYMFLIDIYDG